MGVITVLSNAARITWKDLLDFRRNRLGLVLLIVMPIFMMGLIGFIYPSNGTSVSNVPVAIVDEDSGYHNVTTASQTFLSVLQEINARTGTMKLSTVSSVAEAKDSIQQGNLDGAIIIPSNFTASVMDGKQGTLMIMTDESNPQISVIIDTALTDVFGEIGTMQAQQAVQSIDPSVVNATNSLALVQPYKVQTEGVVAGHANYFDFIAPGMMMMTVMMSVMTGLPAAITQEKEIGTMDGMMVAPINRMSIILGKTVSQMTRGIIQGTIILVLAVTMFGVTVVGNIVLVFALLLLGVFSFVGLGIVVTSFAQDQQTATMLMMTLMFPMMFLSGVFFPIQQMPWYMQDVSKVIPLTYAVDALRRVMVLGASVPDIGTDLIVLVVFGVVMMAIALPVFRRGMTR